MKRSNGGFKWPADGGHTDPELNCQRVRGRQVNWYRMLQDEAGQGKDAVRTMSRREGRCAENAYVYRRVRQAWLPRASPISRFWRQALITLLIWVWSWSRR